MKGTISVYLSDCHGLHEIISKQECIPVGCVSPAAVAIGVCLSACWDTPLGVGLETPNKGVGLETPQVWA